jgi:putative ABC transport system permease protein
MLRNYFKIAFRNLRTQRVYALLNVVGLAVGMASFLLIASYVWHELHYDRFHANADRIYRVVTRVKASGSDDGIARAGIEVGPLLKQTYPEVEESVRLKPTVATLRLGKELVNEKNVYFADPSVLTVFSHPLLLGNTAALDQPNRVVLTKTLAEKYFPARNPLGKTLPLNGEAYVVTGVVADVPSNSDLPFTALLSWRATEAEREDWLEACYTYLLFGDARQAAGFDKKLAQFARSYFGAKIKALGAFDFSVHNEIQPLTAVHLLEDPDYETLDEDTPKGNRTSLLVFAAIAGLLLLVACINYVNLYVAQSLQRQKEVGVRKTLGAGKTQLAAQFMAESALVMTLSLGLAVALVYAASPVFQQFTEKSGVAFVRWSGEFVAAGLGLLVVVGLLTSSYPALYLARFDPVRVLKGPVGGSGKNLLRQSLVVVQFSIAIALTAGTFLIWQQMAFLRTQNPGFRREQVLVVHVPDEDGVRQKMTTFKRQLLADSRIGGVSTGHVPVNLEFKASFVKETNGQKTNLFINTALIDETYLDVLGLRLAAGRNFTGAADREHRVLINEAFVRWMGWEGNPVGRKINPSSSDSLTARVIGVVKNFHYQSLHHAIEPLLLYYGGDRPVSLLVRVKPENLGVVRQAWAALVPDRPFEYTFLDDSYHRQYRQEEKLGTLIGWFSGLTIFIACLGLFGLVTFTAERRTKEIGIRKVLGASVAGIVALLSGDFLKLVFIAIAVASPLAWWAVNRWLQNFAYKIDVGWWVFALAGLLAVGISLLTVSFQSLKAALMNPVKSLRNE